ncbi:MAG: outer membrane protein transport protein, partial [Gammaproteobacteria bacterium]|nr:outer membrane protein transport protein [Gammaproteobacteria bacterium]
MKKLPGILLSTIFLGFTYSSSQAAGFAILEQSTLGLGSAFAGTAVSVDDASTIYFNPAGMVKLDQQVIAASTVILPKAEFSNKSSSTASALGPLGGDLSGDNAAGERSAVVPNFYAVFPVNRSLSAGIGINAPFGLATEYDDNWVGRYHAVESDVRTININPSVALRISPQFTIGAGLNIQQMNVVLSNAIDFASICIAQLNASTCNLLGVAGPQQADGFVQFEGNNNSELGVGWNFGMLAELSSKTRVGLAYRSEVKQHLTGNADFTVPGNVSFLTNTGLFNDGGISADVTLPKNLTLSFMQNLMPKLDLLADVSWTNWAVFDELRIKY